MHRSLRRLTSLTAMVALLATLALGVASAAFGDDWARDRAAAVALQELDPAIRTAIEMRSSEIPIASTAYAAMPSPDDGFAWGAALLGLGAGVIGMCVLLGCVTLVRHDGRLRSA
jgi:hypothetical protein